MDDFQSFPDYDGSQEIYFDGPIYAQGTNKRKRKSGKLSREGERRKKAKYRARNASRYRAYMREYMRKRRNSSPLDVY